MAASNWYLPFMAIGPWTFDAFADELTKIAAKVPFIHGTAGRWAMLKPGVGATVLKNDPNPRAVYTAMKNRAKLPSISRFAQEAEKARGGEAVVAHGKMDTKKGWRPTQLTPWGQKNIGSVEDAHALISELDAGASGKRRGEIWRALHRGTGAWANELDAGATLKPSKYRAVETAQKLKQVA